jgi:glycosyltransferase involved in cell wall biosynthesis
MNILALAFEFPRDPCDAIVSGEVKNAYNFICELARQGHRVTVVSITERPDVPMRTLCGLTVHTVSDRRNRGVVRYVDRAIRIAALVNRLVESGELYDVVHSHVSYGTCGVLWSRARRVPIVTTPHGTNIPEIRTELTGSFRDRLRRVNAEMQRWLDCYAFAGSRRIVSVSRFQLAEMRDLYGIDADRIDVFYNGADRRRYMSAPHPTRAGSASPHVLFVGRAVRKKGLDSVEALAVKNPHWRFTLVVGTPMFNTLGRRLLDALAALPNCRLLEAVSEADMPELYRAADVTLVPSRGYESLPTVILESLACGTPAASVDAWGNPEVIGDPALLFREDDLAGMEAAIRYAVEYREAALDACTPKSLEYEVRELASTFVRLTSHRSGALHAA